MNIAIYGGSGSGKSATAVALAHKLNIEVRGCGDEVKKLAKIKGVAFLMLSDTDHLSVDSQTVDFANQKDGWIIEGRFLDQVLKNVQKPFLLIRLDASAEVRAIRLKNRDSRITLVEDVCKYDADDSQFRVQMYSGVEPQHPHHTIENDQFSVNEVVDRILKLVQY